MKIVRTEDAPHASPEERVHFTNSVGMTRLLEIEEKALVRVQDSLVKVDVTVDDLKLMVDRTSSDVRLLIHEGEA